MIAVVVLIPILAVVLLSLQPSLGSTSTATFTLENFVNIFSQTDVLIWLRNSMMTTLVTVLVSVAVAAPAGYVLSRGRSRLISGFSLVLFIVQSLPIVTAVIPLFILFAQFGLVDTLTGITIIFVGSTMSVAIWMMAAYYDSIPINLEEAAWMDGCSVFGSFLRVVLRNSLPGILSTAIFAFLLAWNDYLVPLVFLRSSEKFIIPGGLAELLPAELDELGPGDGRGGGDDVAAGDLVRGAEPVLQCGWDRRVAGRRVSQRPQALRGNGRLRPFPGLTGRPAPATLSPRARTR